MNEFNIGDMVCHHYTYTHQDQDLIGIVYEKNESSITFMWFLNGSWKEETWNSGLVNSAVSGKKLLNLYKIESTNEITT